MEAELKYYGNPILKQSCETIKEINDEIKSLIDSMVEVMYQHGGIGLAGPQIGVLKQIIVWDTQWPLKKHIKKDHITYTKTPLVMINPNIIGSSKDNVALVEGCLSFPNVEGMILRPRKIKVVYQSRNGKQVEQSFTDLNARVIQHEIDHLNGVLFIDKFHVPQERFEIASALFAIRSTMNKGEIE